MNSKSPSTFFRPPLKASWFKDVLQAAVPPRIQDVYGRFEVQQLALLDCRTGGKRV